ncbi:putative phage tail protein [Anaerovorax odorimutans]|uniref:putative phage tail protein n=1 Tax=Anaerovorax odorimutans TaxID=109327 RepID=UPI000429D9D4|nr:putative phage tail protein [Anaerovorax odorimutans]
MVDLMNLLPPIYDNNTTMMELQEIFSIDITDIKNSFNKTIDECFIDTAEFTLNRWEKECGISVNNELDMETRRARIKSKIRNYGTITISLLKNIIESFENASAEIIEDNSNYIFTIKFNDYYRIPTSIDITKIYEAIEEIKPAHLAFDHTFAYNWWGRTADSGIWNDGGTWDDLRNYKEA